MGITKTNKVTNIWNLPCSIGTGRTGGIGFQNYCEGRNQTGTSSQKAQ